MVISLHSSCFIVLDGVDECSNLQGTLEVINALRRHDIHGAQNPCILVTSRKLYEIQAALTEAHHGGYIIEISLDARLDQSTVVLKRFIENELERKHDITRDLSQELKGQISTALLEKCNGTCVFCIFKYFPYLILWLSGIRLSVWPSTDFTRLEPSTQSRRSSMNHFFHYIISTKACCSKSHHETMKWYAGY